ncbi:shikimate kinase [[Muricauda] lutisoli]|uniref:Shikimate kinase n=1 Tax=[Muricauda] lutisoli TaxID=2816035 RepID=A0ABS3F074_9FLAO|nr:shikimate kinase [[Muricauda] lutisoli]MBO0331888.1 shikimate kinase [[Muricauda] lutisoli]
MKIVLVGYMASGKSTVGRLLARQLGIRFIDLDDYIEEHQKKSIKTIFSEKGEIFFRKLEHQMLNEVLGKEESLVISTGGGTPCYGTNMTIILDEADHSIYLDLSIPNLLDRISKEKENRPLVKNISDKELPEFIGKHLFERRPYYMQAKHILDCNGTDAETVVEKIKELL